MTARDFCYWLQGFIEISHDPPPLTAAQVDIIRRHLALVFAHDIDPKAGGPEMQAKLNAIHSPAAAVKAAMAAGLAFDKDTKMRC
jgi:hypothetical protein